MLFDQVSISNIFINGAWPAMAWPVEFKIEILAADISILKCGYIGCICNILFADRKSKLAKQIKKEIIKVRRQLAIQKGQAMAESDAEEAKANDTGLSSY